MIFVPEDNIYKKAQIPENLLSIDKDSSKNYLRIHSGF